MYFFHTMDISLEMCDTEQTEKFVREERKMDRRQQKTRASIFEAFGELLSQKSYSKITVQEIIDKANVGRTTFYAHFETKDDLLREMCVEMFQHVFSPPPGAENTHDFSLETGNPKAIVTHILYHLLGNRKRCIDILSGEGGELFLGYFRQQLNVLVSQYILTNMPRDGKIPSDFLVNHVASSFVGMVQWWIAGRLRQTPEELADYFMAVISPLM